MKFTAIVILGMAAAASARPRYLGRRASFTKSNGEEAIALNAKFATLDANSACQAGEDACVQDKFAQCVSGKFVTQSCAPGTICAALPLVNSKGTSVTCTTAADRDARIAATGANTSGKGNNASAPPSASGKGGNNAAAASSTKKGSASSTATSAAPSGTPASSDDPQTSLTLDPRAIQKNYAQDGNANATAGQEPSLTSTNNFINFCLRFPDVPQTNGQQVVDGSCNATPMGVIVGKSKMPAARFQNPVNGATIPANKSFNLTVLITNMDLGHFTNPDTAYHMAPQQVNSQGLAIGHSHVVIELLKASNQTDPTDPTQFKFFRGLNDQGKNGVLTVLVEGGLPKGSYRAATITAAANHQPVLVSLAQRGTIDDMSYFDTE